MKDKDELAEGLHLIDFEQLKIENQSLNEKIEDRNEDLHKLKKKHTTTVQIIKHTQEKLEHLRAENSKLDSEQKAIRNMSIKHRRRYKEGEGRYKRSEERY